MQRDEAVSLVKEYVKRENLFKHILAVEAIMRGLARHFGEDENRWALVGLLHDVDFEKTMDEPSKHALMAEEILKGKVDEEIIETIKAHNYEHTGVEPKTRMAKALIAADAVSGLIVAAALVMPSKKLSNVKLETLEKKFKQKDFARGVSRERILFCEEIGIQREKFFELALDALKEVSEELGL